MKEKRNTLKVKPVSGSTGKDCKISKHCCEDTAPKLVYDCIDPEKVVYDIIGYEPSVLDTMSPIMKTDGLYVDDGYIKRDGECNWACGFIPGIAFADHDFDKGKFAACAIANTINAGFRFAASDEDGKTIDLGPVTTPCIIGNVRRPQGIYIPFNNAKSMITGVDYAIDVLTVLKDNGYKIESGE